MRKLIIVLMAALASALFVGVAVAEQKSDTQTSTSKTFGDGSSNTCTVDGKCSCTGGWMSEACKDLKSGECFHPSGDKPNKDGTIPGTLTMECDFFGGPCHCSKPAAKGNSFPVQIFQKSPKAELIEQPKSSFKLRKPSAQTPPFWSGRSGS